MDISSIHPAAPHYIPGYIAGPDGSDFLLTFSIIFLLVILMAVGVFYFKLHSLPEHLGEKHNSTQLQLISVLAVLAIFTHNNAFWVLALLIAVVQVPDFLSPLKAMADSLVALAGNKADPKQAVTSEQQNQSEKIIGTAEQSPPQTSPLRTEKGEE